MGSILEEKIKNILEGKGYIVLSSGWPDFLVINNKQEVYGLEIKSDLDRIKGNQLILHKCLDRIGFPVYICRPNDNPEKNGIQTLNSSGFFDLIDEIEKSRMQKRVFVGNNKYDDEVSKMFFPKFLFKEIYNKYNKLDTFQGHLCNQSIYIPLAMLYTNIFGEAFKNILLQLIDDCCFDDFKLDENGFFFYKLKSLNKNDMPKNVNDYYVKKYIKILLNYLIDRPVENIV